MTAVFDFFVLRSAVIDRRYSLWHELQPAAVHVRRQDGNAHPFAFAHQHRNFFGVIDFVREQTSHEFDRMVRFQKRRLITDQRIGRAMALVESVASKFFKQIKDRVRLFLPDLVGACATGNEICALFRHLFLVLFAHGAPQQIRLPHRITSQLARCRHHLFLVNHHAISVGADFLQERMLVSNFR